MPCRLGQQHLPSAVKKALGRNVRFVDAGDLVHFRLADTIPLQDWIEDKVLSREHVAARAGPEKATHSNVSEDEASARALYSRSIAPIRHP
jgi:hypothetical protein